jgi:hypothetical protein
VMVPAARFIASARHLLEKTAFRPALYTIGTALADPRQSAM